MALTANVKVGEIISRKDKCPK